MARGHEISFTDVSRAVSLVTGLAPELQEIVNLSGSVHSKIRNDPNLRTTSLGQDSIKSLIFSSMPPEVLELMDPAKRAEAQRAQAERGNVTGSAYAQAFAMSGAQAGLAFRDGIHVGGHGTNSARFDSVANIKGDWNSPAGQAYMREFAMQHGLSWAANNPDLLRLGPSAITALAEASIKQETYQRMTREGGFKAKDVVTVAKFAKDKGVDGNELGNTLVESNRALATDQKGRVDPKKQEELRRAEIEYMAKPDDPKTKAKLDEVLKPYESDPAKKPTVDKLKKSLGAQVRQEAKATHNEKASAQRADDRRNEVDGKKDEVAALLADPKAGQESKGETPKPEGPKVEKADRALVQHDKKRPASPSPGK